MPALLFALLSGSVFLAQSSNMAATFIPRPVELLELRLSKKESASSIPQNRGEQTLLTRKEQEPLRETIVFSSPKKAYQSLETLQRRLELWFKVLRRLVRALVPAELIQEHVDTRNTVLDAEDEPSQTASKTEAIPRALIWQAPTGDSTASGSPKQNNPYTSSVGYQLFIGGIPNRFGEEDLLRQLRSLIKEECCLKIDGLISKEHWVFVTVPYHLKDRLLAWNKKSFQLTRTQSRYLLIEPSGKQQNIDQNQAVSAPSVPTSHYLVEAICDVDPRKPYRFRSNLPLQVGAYVIVEGCRNSRNLNPRDIARVESILELRENEDPPHWPSVIRLANETDIEQSKANLQWEEELRLWFQENLPEGDGKVMSCYVQLDRRQVVAIRAGWIDYNALLDKFLPRYRGTRLTFLEPEEYL